MILQHPKFSKALFTLFAVAFRNYDLRVGEIKSAKVGGAVADRGEEGRGPREAGSHAHGFSNVGDRPPRRHDEKVAHGARLYPSWHYSTYAAFSATGGDDGECSWWTPFYSRGDPGGK